MEHTLGDRIRIAREVAGLTRQEDLAKKLGCEAATVSRWENDERQPDLAMIAKISEVTSVSICQLLALRCSASDILRQLMHASEPNGPRVKGYTLNFSFKVDADEEE